MEYKPAKPNSLDQYSSTASRSKGCGCVGIGCLVTVILLVVLCVGSYFAMLHTSLPLAMIERAIEADGHARVEGLRGSISSGFEMDKLEFESEDGKHWNEFRDVKFAFNGLFDLFRRQRFVIEEASIGGATIYSDYENPEVQNESDPELDFSWLIEGIEDPGEEVRDALRDMRREMQGNDAPELAEIRVDLINVRNIELVNPVSDERLKIEQVEFRDFRIARGEVQSLGQITVKSDFLDMDTSPSMAYPSEKLAWQLNGTVKTEMHPVLNAPLPFQIDFAIFENDKSAMKASLFDGAVRIEDPNSDHIAIRVEDFTPSQYFKPGTEAVPAHWFLEITSEKPQGAGDSQDVAATDEKAPEETETVPGQEPVDQPDSEPQPKTVKRIVSFLPGGHFRLGQTQFELDPARFEVVSNSEPPLVLTATGKLGATEISARLRSQRKAPYLFVELSAAGMEPKEIWAKLIFEKTYDELEQEQKAAIDKVLVPAMGKIVDPVDF